jgi:DNA-binding transcriptional LysR family regulator
MGFARGELPQTLWPSSGGNFQVDGALFTNDLGMLCDAALAGLGIALLPMIIGVGPHLESGALVHVLPGTITGETQIAVVYPEREFLPPQVRAFIDAVVVWAAEELGPRVSAPKVQEKQKRAAEKRRGKGG